MNNPNNNNRILMLCVLILIIGIAAAGIILFSDVTYTKIDIPNYLLISMGDDGSYQYAIDKQRIRRDFYFPDDLSLPENKSLDSLTLITNNQGECVSFEVGSHIENAGQMLNKGGYVLTETTWKWNTKEISSQYTSLLSVHKSFSLKDHIHYHSDGNSHWTPYIDYHALYDAIGDRIKYDSTLKALVDSLTVSSSTVDTSSYKIETWSSYDSPMGLSIRQIMDSSKVSIVDTVFIISKEEILSVDSRVISLIPYCFKEQAGNEVHIEIDKAMLKADLSFSEGSNASNALDALSLNTILKDEGFLVSVCSNATDMDVIKALSDNGVLISETTFLIHK